MTEPEVRQHNPAEVARKQKTLLKKTAQFCALYLDDEMKELCALAIEEPGRSEREIPFAEPEWWGLAPLERGDLKIWAGGIVYALASANGLFKPGALPRLKAASLDEFFGLRKGAAVQRANSIRDLLRLDRGDSQFFTAAMLQRRAQQETVFAASPELGFERGTHEFVDDLHNVATVFYELHEEFEDLEELDEEELLRLEAALRELVERDPFFLDTYLSLAEIKENDDDDEAAREWRDMAYTQALRLIRDSKGRWPAALEWDWFENRHILRALGDKAMQSWSSGANDEALAIFRNMLFACPADQLGVRYFILGVLNGLNPEQYDKRFVTKSGHYNPEKLSRWFFAGVAKFPNEFTGWFQALREREMDPSTLLGGSRPDDED